MLGKEASEEKDHQSVTAAQYVKPPLFKRVAIAIASIENLAFLCLKTVVFLMLLIMIWKMALWVCVEDKGVVIQPFDTDGIGNGLDGKSIAQLLGCELQKIQAIDQQAETIGIPNDFQIDEVVIPTPNSVKSSLDSAKLSGEDSAQEMEMTSSLIGSNPQSDFGFLFLKGESLKYTISSMGSLGFGGASLPAGNLLLFLKELVGSTPSTIEGSIQKYNSNIIIVAIMEDHRSSDSGIVSWDIRRNATADNNSLNDQIPLMIKNLSFRIALDLARRWQSEKDFPRSWKSLEYLILAQEQFINYNRTGILRDLDKSRDLAIEAMRTDPGYDKTLGLLSKQALIYLGNNNSREAEEIFHIMKAFRPFEGSVGLGLVYSNNGRYEEACREYEEALGINKSSKSTWLKRGKTLFYLGKFEEAIMSYDQALKIDPNYVKARNGRGDALAFQSKLDEAIKSYDGALKIDSKSAYAWTAKGNALRSQSKFGEAIKSYNEALRIDPKSAYAWTVKGNALMSLGKFDEAIKSYDEALKIDPKYVYAWNNKGNALRSLGKFDKAIKSYDEALRIDPKYFYSWIGKGNALRSQSKFGEAIKSYDEALKIDPKSAYTLTVKGNALMSQGKFDEAIKSYDDALEIDPKYVYAWNNKGNALRSQGKFDKAIKSYDESLSINQNNTNAINGRSIALQAQAKLA
jgi:tetratricopeptide (TPR) repeat protein